MKDNNMENSPDDKKTLSDVEQIKEMLVEHIKQMQEIFGSKKEDVPRETSSPSENVPRETSEAKTDECPPPAEDTEGEGSLIKEIVPNIVEKTVLKTEGDNKNSAMEILLRKITG